MIIDGKAIATAIQHEIKAQVIQLPQRAPCLAVILAGDHPPSQIYIRRKTQACESVGIRSIKIELPATISEEALLSEVHACNANPAIDGILVQLPLPSQINPMHIIHAISPQKDVDGFHPYNIGKVLLGETNGFIPCTPLGIQTLLKRSSIDLTGKHALVIGRSNIVGKPVAALLMQSSPEGNATVTIAHQHTQHLEQLSRMADVIIIAIGRPQFLKADMVKEGVVIIDVGINKISDPLLSQGYRIVGDVDFEAVAPKCSYITPVPGGVGPMTIAMLLQNTLQAYMNTFKLSEQ